MLSLAGIRLEESKRNLVYNRLARRLRALGLDDFGSYCRHLEAEPAEAQELINAITTNLTAFFREEHHFQHLEQHLRERPPRPGQRIRIWSAGCSTGEEPYSMAMVLARLGLQTGAAAILATDIDTEVLRRARTGLYREEAVRDLPPAAASAFEPAGPSGRRVVRAVRALVTFNRLNLMAQSWPMRHPFDAIFCRNVLIYFDRATQARLIDRFSAALLPGGLLCLGHSESLHDARGFRSVGVTAYRKLP